MSDGEDPATSVELRLLAPAGVAAPAAPELPVDALQRLPGPARPARRAIPWPAGVPDWALGEVLADVAQPGQPELAPELPDQGR